MLKPRYLDPRSCSRPDKPNEAAFHKRCLLWNVGTSLGLLEPTCVCVCVCIDETLTSAAQPLYFISALRRFSFSGLLEAIWEKSLKIS